MRFVVLPQVLSLKSSGDQACIDPGAGRQSRKANPSQELERHLTPRAHLHRLADAAKHHRKSPFPPRCQSPLPPWVISPTPQTRPSPSSLNPAPRRRLSCALEFRKIYPSRRRGGNVGIVPFTISKESWERWETALSFSTVSTLRHFHGAPTLTSSGRPPYAQIATPKGLSVPPSK